MVIEYHTIRGSVYEVNWVTRRIRRTTGLTRVKPELAEWTPFSDLAIFGSDLMVWFPGYETDLTQCMLTSKVICEKESDGLPQSV